MKKRFTLFSLLIPAHMLMAQVVQEVHFDYYNSPTDNDFENNFDNGPGLVQIQTNGITAGCLQTPDSVDWGNANAYYCSRYAPQIGDTARTSICFKYDSTQINLPSYQRALSMWLWPNADFNHYIIASVSGNKKLELLTYSWSNNPYPDLALWHDHWYRYELRAIFQGGANNQVLIQAEVSDLGITGTSSPVLVNSSNGAINDSVLVRDTSIHVGVSATVYGGARYLDDFHFEGRLGATSCINTTGIAEEQPAHFKIFPVPAHDYIFIERPESASGEVIAVSVFTTGGKRLNEIVSSEKRIAIPVSDLSAGVYFVKCNSATTERHYKMIVGE